MTELAPTTFLWKDDVLVPATSYQLTRCREHFTEGERYDLVENHERTAKSHKHYFAQLREAWLNLPEDIAHEFPTVHHLRAAALIATGFYHQRSVMCSSQEEARRVAAFVAPLDEYALVSVNGTAVVMRSAKSQNYRAMDKKEFARSKEAVLAWVWNLVGVDPALGNREAGQAA